MVSLRAVDPARVAIGVSGRRRRGAGRSLKPPNEFLEARSWQRLLRLVETPGPGPTVHENDPATHFEPLLSLLQAVVVTKDYANPAIDAQIGASTVAARNAGFSPEALIAYLRHQVHEAPLTAVGDWSRAVLVERLVARAIDAYFGTNSDEPPRPRPAAPHHSSPTGRDEMVDTIESRSPTT